MFFTADNPTTFIQLMYNNVYAITSRESDYGIIASIRAWLTEFSDYKTFRNTSYIKSYIKTHPILKLITVKVVLDDWGDS